MRYRFVIMSLLVVLLAGCQVPLSRQVLILDHAYVATANTLRATVPLMDAATAKRVAIADNITYKAVKTADAAVAADSQADAALVAYQSAMAALAQLNVEIAVGAPAAKP
jgi:hypothetical protein